MNASIFYSAMLERAGALFVFSLVFLICYEYLYIKIYEKSSRELPLPLGFVTILLVICFRLSGGWLGGLCAIHLFATPSTDRLVGRLIFLGAFLLSLWISAILLQVLQNCVRFTLGRPPQPIEFMRGPRRSPARPKAKT
ncbi:MAG: hypothetical protein M3N08_06785 [Pseudomonadota bacterium]|nr:hypothetical protein [Pseudomonadota bacterium]